MSVKTLWQNLKTLVDCDRNILQTEAKIKDIHSDIEKNKNQIAQLLAARETKKTICARERKNVALFELQAAEFKAAEDEKRVRLNNIKDQKEFRAIEKELQAICQKSNTLEDQLVQSWQSMEQAIKTLGQETLASELKIAALQEEITAHNELIDKTRETIANLTQNRVQATVHIPEEWLTKYNRMKHSLQDPIVPVHGMSCSSCFYTIIKQDFANLKKVGMLPCRSCYRLLYYIDTVDQEKTEIPTIIDQRT